MGIPFFKPAGCRSLILALTLTGGFILLPLPLRADAPVLEKRFPSTFHVTQTVALGTNTLDVSGARDPEFVLAVPFPRTNDYHEVRNLKISGGDILYFPETHDGYVRLIFNSPPKGLVISYDIVTYRIFTRWDRIQSVRPYDTSNPEYRRNTKSLGRINTDHPRIQAIARHLRKESANDVDYLRKAYLWGQQNLAWKATGHYYSIDEILENEGGDAGALSTILISLLRCQGIPARYMTGITFSDAKVENHVWVEVFLEGTGWISMDPSYYAGESMPYLGYYDGRRIFFNRGQEFTLSTGRGSFPLSELQTYATYYSMRDGQIWGGYDYTVQFTVKPVRLYDESAWYNDPSRIQATTDAALNLINRKRTQKGLPPFKNSSRLNELAQKILDHPEVGDPVADSRLKFKRVERWNISRLLYMLEPADGASPYFPWHLAEDPGLNSAGIGYRYDGSRHNFYFLFFEEESPSAKR